MTTSGGYGHFTKKSLGFGYVPPEISSAGTELDIVILGEPCKARVLADPVHDPVNERLRV
ncbi:MAG: glycine cleavage T C-terminal barrel domain-containing protein [Woeseiales bacterium]